MRNILTKQWADIYEAFEQKAKEYGDHYEAISFSYAFSPLYSVMSKYKALFDAKKAAAMYFWYKRGDREDYSILGFFDEYKRCLDTTHIKFNSNYGFYAYTKGGLDKCVIELERNQASRHAMFCINNNEAMSDLSIDKLCTNTIQFFIRDLTLHMVVQMRSSNFITLLPYDAFMFSVFYIEVYRRLLCKYPRLLCGQIYMQVASLQLFKSDKNKLMNQSTKFNDNALTLLSTRSTWKAELERRLIKALTD